MTRYCITCGDPTRRTWYDWPVCYRCAGVSCKIENENDPEESA